MNLLSAHSTSAAQPASTTESFSSSITRAAEYPRAASNSAMFLIRYLATLTTGRLILWCYFIWYIVVLVRYFDPNRYLWLTSLGLSVIIGVALYISTTSGSTAKIKLEFWQVVRLFLMPFCVSSFAALVKGKGFILIFSPRLDEIGLAVGLCLCLCLIVWVLKRSTRS